MKDVINRTCDTCKYGDPEGYGACWNADSPYRGDWAPYETCDKWEEKK